MNSGRHPGGDGRLGQKWMQDEGELTGASPNPRVVCVVVHHTGELMLSACLHSVLDSKGIDVDVVVVANACREPLPSWIAGATRVHVLEPKVELGFAEANNFGVWWVTDNLRPPDAYLFLNNDAIVEPTTLRTLADVFEGDSRCAAVGPKILVWGAPETVNSFGLNVTEVGEAWDEGIGRPADEYRHVRTPYEVLALTGAALMVRSEALGEISGWSKLYRYYLEDIDLCIRLRSAGWSVRVVPTATAYHAISATSRPVTDFKVYYSWRNQLILLAARWPLRLLFRVCPRLFASQAYVFWRRLRVRARGDARLQLRAWLGALAMMPRAVLDRYGAGGDTNWVDFLCEPGSVPVIELPVVEEAPWKNLPAENPEMTLCTDTIDGDQEVE